MADVTVQVHDTKSGNTYALLLHDNGDGTYSFAGGGGGTAGTPAGGVQSVQGVTGGTPQPVVGFTTTVGTSFAKSAGVTAYPALDVVGPAVTANLVFADIARVAGGSGYLTGLRLWTNQSTNVARYKVHLYHTAPTAIADNGVFTLLWANRDKRIGSVTLPALATEGTGSDAASAHDFTIRIPFKCVTRDIFAIVETLDGFTPADGQLYYLELTAEQN